MNKKANKETTTTPAGSKGKLGVIVIAGKAYSVISVMRKMGYVGFTLPELQEVMKAHVDGETLQLPAEHTMKLALKRGKDEAKGIDTGRKVADVSEKDLREWAGVQKAKKGGKKGKGGKKQEATAPEPGVDPHPTQDAEALVEAAA